MFLKTVGVRPSGGTELLKRGGLPLAALVACAGSAAQAQPVQLGAATSFAVLAGSQVTNTGPTHIYGDLGVSPGTSITGNPPCVVTGGSIRVNDAVAVQAHADAATAYAALAGMAVNTELTGQDLGSRTLPPGVYHFSSSAQLTGQLILDGQNAASPRFVFQIGSTLTTASGASIVLINGAVESDVFFQVGSSATLGTGTNLVGTIIAQASDTLTTGANVNGRVICLDGAVTLDNNQVSGLGPHAVVTNQGVTNGGTYMDVAVLYTDAAESPVGISPSSVHSGNVELAGPFSYLEAGTLLSTSVPQTGQILATYRFTARDGCWDWTDNGPSAGAYPLRMLPNQVMDLQGHAVPAQTLYAYGLYFENPNAVVTSVSVAAGGTQARVTVVYSANHRFMSWDSIGSGDLELDGPGGFVGTSTMVSRSYNASTNSYTVVYQFPARGGSWEGSDNGTYSVRVRPNEVWDAAGYLVPPVQLASYWWWFPAGFYAPNCGSSDFDGDGEAGTDADIQAWFACIAGNCCETCGSADFNGDGDIGTEADIEAFFRVLAGGAC